MGLARCCNCGIFRDSDEDQIVFVKNDPYCRDCAVGLSECYFCGSEIDEDSSEIDHDPILGAQAYCKKCWSDWCAQKTDTAQKIYKTFGLIK